MIHGGHNTIIIIVACVCVVVITALVAGSVVYVTKYKLKKRATNGTAGMTSHPAVPPSIAHPAASASWHTGSPTVAVATPEKSPRPGGVHPGVSDTFSSVDPGAERAGNSESVDNNLNEGLPPYSV